MKYYLVDCENVKVTSENDLTEIVHGDQVIFFYSARYKKMTMQALSMIDSSGYPCSSFEIKAKSPNALDFQLSSFLGYLIGQCGKQEKYYIVAADKGYGCLHEFWQAMGIDVERIIPQTFTLSSNDSKGKKKSAKKQKKLPENVTLKKIEDVLLDVPEKELILQIVNQNNRKEDIYKQITKHFRNMEQAVPVYRKLKPLLKARHKL